MCVFAPIVVDGPIVVGGRRLGLSTNVTVGARTSIHTTHGTYLGTQGAGSSSYLGCRYRLPGIPEMLGVGRYRGPVGTQGAGTACLEYPRCWVLEGTEAVDPIAPNGR